MDRIMNNIYYFIYFYLFYVILMEILTHLTILFLYMHFDGFNS
jgi:hypothetical protein